MKTLKRVEQKRFPNEHYYVVHVEFVPKNVLKVGQVAAINSKLLRKL